MSQWRNFQISHKYEGWQEPPFDFVRRRTPWKNYGRDDYYLIPNIPNAIKIGAPRKED